MTKTAWSIRAAKQLGALQAIDGQARSWMWLADAVGMRRSRLTHLRFGNGKPQMSEARAISATLLCDVETIFDPSDIVPDGQGATPSASRKPTPFEAVA